MKEASILGVVPAVLIAASIIGVIALDLSQAFVYQDAALLFTLNVIFLTGTSLAVAAVSARSFLSKGSPNILLLGCAVLVGGLAALIAGLVSFWSANYNNIIYNISIAVSGGLQFWTAAVTLGGQWSIEARNRKAMLVVAYTGVVLFVAVLTTSTLWNLIPPFMTSSGATPLRGEVLGVAVVCFGLGFVLFLWQYYRSRSSVIFRYSQALGLFALGLLSAFFVHQSGEVLTWLARAAIYVGGFYFLAAILSPPDQLELVERDLAERWTEAFRGSQQQLTTLFSKLLNAFSYHRIITDESGKPIDYVYLAVNDAFEKMTGLKREDVVGKRVTEILPGIEKDPADWIGKYGKVALTGQSVAFESHAVPLDRWFSVSAYSPAKGYFVAIFEDITERKKAEEGVRESEERFRSVLANSLDVVYRFNLRTGRYEYMSPAIRSMGFEPEEMTAMANAEVLSRVHPEDLPALQADLTRLAQTGRGVSEYRFMGKDGIYRWWSNQMIITMDANGKPLYRDGYVRDITERKKAEEKLGDYTKNLEALVKERTQKLESSALYARSLIEASLDPLVTINAEGKITDVNKATEEATGFSREQLIGSDFSDYFTEPEKARAGYLQVFTKGFVIDYSLAMKHKSGKTKDVLYNATVYRNEAGQIQGVFAAARDVTERKLAEEEVRAASLYSRSLIEASLDPLVTINAEGKITDVNKATEFATGCSREELIGSDFSNYFTDPEKAAAGYKQVFINGFVTDYPLAIKHKSGRIIEVVYNAAVYRNEEGQVQGVFAAARDVTERRKLEKKLGESERLAAIGATAGMVGHDIRNPLQAIAGDVYLARNDLRSIPDGDTKVSLTESLEGIQENVDYISKIVQDLQDYARPLNPIAEEVNLKPLFEDMLVKNGIPGSIRATFKVYENAEQVIADPELLKRVISNLVSNAVQAMPAGGRLAIRARRDKSNTVIEVQDTGVGIPEELKPKLFLPLFTTKAKGQGFGLAVVKRVTEAMNGTVAVESQVGKGAKFMIRLPSPTERQNAKR